MGTAMAMHTGHFARQPGGLSLNDILGNPWQHPLSDLRTERTHMEAQGCTAELIEADGQEAHIEYPLPMEDGAYGAPGSTSPNPLVCDVLQLADPTQNPVVPFHIWEHVCATRWQSDQLKFWHATAPFSETLVSIKRKRAVIDATTTAMQQAGGPGTLSDRLAALRFCSVSYNCTAL